MCHCVLAVAPRPAAAQPHSGAAKQDAPLKIAAIHLLLPLFCMPPAFADSVPERWK
ncbi:hypothetical protein JYU34_015286 [Plutella xylostella]|uniref:Uncharacterized protein n=1 Tax=Plutella xylostella TaxID=51655 RepID=A0ABQ7Q737_PLUXY|nr:hypothetical protein JYU34_015286 [Plutella xylostella]